MVVDNASENNDVKRVIADGAYDSKENPRYLFYNQIEAAVKVRKNSNQLTGCRCHPRKIIVLQQLKSFEMWTAKVNYRSRWITETVFSSMKRMFEEYVSAKVPSMAKEIFLKTSLPNMFITMKQPINPTL